VYQQVKGIEMKDVFAVIGMVMSVYVIFILLICLVLSLPPL